MTEEQEKKLLAATGTGKAVWFKDKATAQPVHWGTVEDEVYILVGDYKHLIQRIRFADGVSWDGSQFGYRTGYYTFDKNMKNVKWGQFHQFLTEIEYREILGKAKAKGWPIL